MPITRMNHAVLYVRDARRTEGFYRDILGFTTVIEDPQGAFVFMRAPASENHHDIAFFTIGKGAAPSEAGRRTVGMYHVAWEVPTLEELAEMRERLQAAGALVGASDHGANKSLYAPRSRRLGVRGDVAGSARALGRCRETGDHRAARPRCRTGSLREGGPAMSKALFDPVARRTVSAQIRQQLADAITTGQLAPGSPLPTERVLCQEFNVARTSIDVIASRITDDLGEFRAIDQQFHGALARACGNPLLTEVKAKALASLFGSGEFASLLYAEVNRTEVAGIIAESTLAHQAIAQAVAAGHARKAKAAVIAHLDDVERRMVERLL